MDLYQLNVVVSLGSGAMMLGAIVYMLTYMLGSFSSRSGAIESPRIVLFTVVYFFGSSALLLMGVEWLAAIARESPEIGQQPFFLNIGASALGLNALIHLFCGFLTVFLFLRGRGYLDLGRILDRVRSH